MKSVTVRKPHPSLETPRHGVRLFSTVFYIAVISHSLHFPPCLLVFPTSSFSIRTYPHDPQTSLQPRAPSPTSPDEFPMNVKQAYKAFAAVPRSLAVLEPPQVGPAARTDRVTTTKHAVLVSPRPFTDQAVCAVSGNVLWRVECLHRLCCTAIDCHTCVTSWTIYPLTCGLCTNDVSLYLCVVPCLISRPVVVVLSHLQLGQLSLSAFRTNMVWGTISTQGSLLQRWVAIICLRKLQ